LTRAPSEALVAEGPLALATLHDVRADPAALPA
jgi:hypothetical protein